jgi:hypothetical protein
LQKKNENSLILEASTPFKNQQEGDKFRNWVNDTYPDWAKQNQLDRSGKFNNTYIQKAYQKFGGEYKPNEVGGNDALQKMINQFGGKNVKSRNDKTKSTDFNLAKQLMNNFHKPVNDENKLQVASSTSRPYVLVDFYPNGNLVIQKDKDAMSSVYDKKSGTWYTLNGELVMLFNNKKYIIKPSNNNQFWDMLKDSNYLSLKDSSFVEMSTEEQPTNSVIDWVRRQVSRIGDLLTIKPHYRAYINFLKLRKRPFTENDLTKSEIESLKEMVNLQNKTKGIPNNKPTRIDFYDLQNKLNTSGEQIDFKADNLGFDQRDVKSNYLSLALTIGNGTISKENNQYVIRDIYDFNNYYKHPEKYDLKNAPSTVKEAIKKIGSNNLVQGVEELTSYYQAAGYEGYPIEIRIPVA